MVFWMAERTVKFLFVTDVGAIRFLWYCYYLPMLLIPFLSVLVVASLGKPENYRLPRWTRLLYLPVAALALLVLTNDFHQLVFAFPADAAVWTDGEYAYRAGYFVVAGCMGLCALIALGLMLFKCRGRKGRKTIWLPPILILLCGIYAVLYVLNINDHTSLLYYLAGDLTAALCLMFAGTLESGALRIKAAPIRGGYAVWQEDVSDLMRVQAELNEIREELQDRNELLCDQYRQGAQRYRLEEQNRLYDLVQRETQSQLRAIDALASDLSRPENTAALFLLAMDLFARDQEAGVEAVNGLRGPRPLNNMDIQFLRDRLRGKTYLPLAYFDGASPENGYRPSQPLTLQLYPDPCPQDCEKDFVRVFLKTSGADSPRGIKLRRKGENWYLWEYSSVLTGIRLPTAEDPWA